MNEYYGGTKAVNGVYLNRADGELVQVHAQAQVLPGTKDTRYIKIPAALAVLGGPMAGLALVMFLPFIGIVGMIGFLGYKAWHGTATVARKVFQPVAVGQEPGMAYLTQRRGGKQTTKDTGATDAGIEKLADEVAQRREQGEK